ncbi:hypothetical protein C2G38_2187687 [Gigaspora rosea]|uniref:PH domain-containing protein n=1 Tax=Gigaspora rosea TaxID=44941 RepID=A0A397V5J4_9GLOM|nr:hypothetical protein C2G38_2187687 [Gigaspora rosea]
MLIANEFVLDELAENLQSHLIEKEAHWLRLNFNQNTLQNCLPHIRYFQMFGNDIINNVQPYHRIFEKNLWKVIMNKYLTNEPICFTVLPPRRENEESKPNQFEENNKIFFCNVPHATQTSKRVVCKDIGQNKFKVITKNGKEYELEAPNEEFKRRWVHTIELRAKKAEDLNDIDTSDGYKKIYNQLVIEDKCIEISTPNTLGIQTRRQ